MADNNSTPYSVAPQNVPYFSDGSVLRDLGKLEGSIESMQMSIAEIKDDVKTLKERERVKPSDFQAVKSDVEKLTPMAFVCFGSCCGSSSRNYHWSHNRSQDTNSITH